MTSWKDFEFINLIVQPMFLFSATFFPLAVYPESIRWLVQLMRRFESGEGTQADLETLEEVGRNMIGRSFCALGDSAPVPIQSALKYFKDEFMLGTTTPASQLFDPVAASVYSGAHA
mgnify:CR=1 FL=1